MNCQAVSVPEGGQVLLSMLGDTPAMSLTIGCSYSFPVWYPLRSPFPLLITQQKAFFASLWLGDKLAYLHINHNSSVTLGPLFDFLRRHPSIRDLSLEPVSILPVSITVGPALDTDTVTLSELSTPAMYIPYIRSTVSGVEELKIHFDGHMQYDTYACTLGAIHAWPVHTLTLRFPLYGPDAAAFSLHALPWRAGVKTGVEARLHRVRTLNLRFYFTAADVELLVNWLDRFPALMVVVLDDWNRIHMADPVVLE